MKICSKIASKLFFLYGKPGTLHLFSIISIYFIFFSIKLLEMISRTILIWYQNVNEIQLSVVLQSDQNFKIEWLIAKLFSKIVDLVAQYHSLRKYSFLGTPLEEMDAVSLAAVRILPRPFSFFFFLIKKEIFRIFQQQRKQYFWKLIFHSLFEFECIDEWH